MKQLSTLILFIGLLTGNFNSVVAQSDKNTFVGYQAGMSLSTGLANTLLGNQAGVNTTSGNQNTFIGSEAGKANSTG
ncbi:hypothetical protein [Spirosoma litoris]